MNTSETFKDFLLNIKISEDKANDISYRYGRITKALNLEFRDTESKTANSLQVGSYGRYTGIKGISDLDMLYIMPNQNGMIMTKPVDRQNYCKTPKLLLPTLILLLTLTWTDVWLR
jgi:hypothetical protein